MKTRQVLIGCGIALVIVIIGAGALVFWLGKVVTSSTSGMLKASPEMKQAGVRKGAGMFTKSVFLADPRLGQVSDIALGVLDRGRGFEIGIAGSAGAAFVSTTGSPKAFTSYGQSLDRARIIDVDNDGNCEFMNRGSWMSPVVLVGHKGNKLWEFGKQVDDAAPGDINGDGKLEFAVGFNGSGGVSLVNAQGKELWNKPDGNVWHVEMVDASGDGRLEILHSNAGGAATVRNARGDTVSQARPTGYFSHFSVCSWPTSTDPLRCLSLDTGTVWVLNLDGSVAAKLAAPSCRMLGNVSGTPFEPQPGKPGYLAVLASYQQWNRSALWLFDSKKQLVYEEVLPENCTALAALRLGSSQAETLLVGGNGTVTRYDFKGAKP